MDLEEDLSQTFLHVSARYILLTLIWSSVFPSPYQKGKTSGLFTLAWISINSSGSIGLKAIFSARMIIISKTTIAHLHQQNQPL